MGHSLMDMATFFSQCSDLDTDDGKREKQSPWPPFMQEEVWTDRCVFILYSRISLVGVLPRLKLRRILKEQTPTYSEFLEIHGDAFAAWWQVFEKKARYTVHSTNITTLINAWWGLRLFQVPKEDLSAILSEGFQMQSAYNIVLVFLRPLFCP